MLSIISFNLRCCGEGDTSVATRAPLMVQKLSELQADSIGMQEATPEWMDFLKQGLGEKYDYVGVARDDGQNKGEYGPVFYRKDKFTLLEQNTFWLSRTPEKPSRFLSSACTRICTYAVLKDKESGKVFSHINTHLDHVSESARLKQADVLLRFIKKLETYGPVICTGDFNVHEDAPVYKKMTETMADIKYTAPVSDKCGTFHNYHPEGVENDTPIDFVFYQGKLEPLTYRVIKDKVNGIFLSDHYGLYTEFQT